MRAKSTNVPAHGGRVPLWTKLGYGLGSVASGVALEALAPSLIVLYLSQAVGLTAGVVGFAIMVSLVIDAVIDPLIGRWSDRLRTRWGRRHPFMYGAALPSAGAVYFMWHAPAHASPALMLAYTLSALTLLRLTVSLYEIPSAALAPEITADYHERTSLMGYRISFRSIGAAAMLVLLYGVFLRRDATHKLGILNRAGYETWGTIAACVILVSILASAISTHGLIPNLKKIDARKLPITATFAEIFVTLTNPSLLVLTGASVLAGLSAGVLATLNVYFNLHFWGFTPQVQAGLLVPLLIAAVIGAVIAAPVSRRFGKKQTLVRVWGMSLFTSLGPIALRLLGLMPANGSPWLLPVLLSTAFVNAALVIMGAVVTASMIADVVEDDAVRTGVRSEGLLFAANSLLPKLTAGVGAFVGTGILELVRFPVKAQQGTVATGTLHHLAELYLPCVAFFNVLAIVVVAFYSIDERTHVRNVELLRDAAVPLTGED